MQTEELKLFWKKLEQKIPLNKRQFIQGQGTAGATPLSKDSVAYFRQKGKKYE